MFGPSSQEPRLPRNSGFLASRLEHGKYDVRKQRAFANAHLQVATKHAGPYACWPTYLRDRYETAARFNALADGPSPAHAMFAPPEPVT